MTMVAEPERCVECGRTFPQVPDAEGTPTPDYFLTIRDGTLRHLCRECFGALKR